MAIGTSEGSTVFIGPVTDENDLAGLEGLTYIEIGNVESIGEFGPQANDSSFTPLKGPSVQHLKGAIDNGMLPIVYAHDPLDAAIETSIQKEGEIRQLKAVIEAHARVGG